MAYTEAQLEARILALETALSRGERTVQYADRSVTYHDAEEIERRLAYFQRKLVTLTGPRSRQFVGVASRGLV